MANTFGYNQQFTDKPETWTSYTKVAVGATGAPSITVNMLTSTGVITPVSTTGPSAIVASVVRLGVGKYQINLAQPWIQCLYADFTSLIPSPLTPAYVSAQWLADVVGTGANPQYVQVQFNVAGTPTDLPSGASFSMQLALKRSSA